MYSYAVRLSKLDVPSLELRRLHMDLIMYYKIVFGLIDVKFDDFFQLSTVVTTRGHSFKLFKKYSDVNARKSFFSQRIINVWNSDGQIPIAILFKSRFSGIQDSI